MAWHDQRVLVTGATGIVGSWLTRALVEKGAYVVTLIRDWDPQSELIRTGLVNETHVVNGSLEDFATLERAVNEHEVDTVFHLGAQTIVGTALRNPLPTFEANIRGSYHLLEACRIHAKMVKRIVVASSDKAYGQSAELPYTEDMPLQGRHPYDVSKSCVDLIARAYYCTYDLPVAIARCGNIYGGGDLNWSRIVPGTIRNLLRNERPIIRSDGKFIRDYIYVEDVVSAYLSLAEALDGQRMWGESFNFGPRKPLSVIDIVNEIKNMMGKEDIAPVILDQARAEIKDQYLSFEKAGNILGWQPQFTLQQGLERTIAWYRSLLDDPCAKEY